MLAILSLLTIICLSIVVTRVASVALSQTGLSMEAARFQARSAFTGVGFTTTESERLVNHPVRRRILLLLMLLGNAGIVSAASTLILTGFSLDTEGFPFWKVLILVTGLGALWLIGTSAWVDRHLSGIIAWALRRYTDLDVRDYAGLLQLDNNYGVSELAVESHDWLAHRSLAELELRKEGVLVLGVVRRDGSYVGTPVGETVIAPDDTLILYGRLPRLEALDRREQDPQGEREHRLAVAEQEAVVEQETPDAAGGREPLGEGREPPSRPRTTRPAPTTGFSPPGPPGKRGLIAR